MGRIAGLALISSFTSLASAQEAPDAAADDPAAEHQAKAGSEPEPVLHVVVTGKPLPPSDQSAAVEVLGPVRLNSEPSGRVENSLTDAVGVQQYRRSDARTAHPTDQGLTLRGLGGNAASRALVLLDGVPQADPFGGWISWPGYDALPLQSVRIERGGGTGRWGPGALAGTIELETLPATEPHATGSALVGSRDTLSTRFSLTRPTGPLWSTAAASYEAGNGSSPIAPEQRGPVDRPAAYEQMGGALRTLVPLSADHQLDIFARAFQDQRERGVRFTENENRGADLAARIRFLPRGSLSWSARAYLQQRELSASFASVSDDRSSASQVLDQYRVPSTGAGARFEVERALGLAAVLRLGADWRMTQGRTQERYLFVESSPTRERRAGGRSDTLGTFQGADVRVTETFVLSAGTRFDFWSLRDGFRKETEFGANVLTDEHPTGRSGTEGTARVGLTWWPAKTWKLRSAAYTGWRLPIANAQRTASTLSCRRGCHRG